MKKSLFLFSLIVILSSEALAYESERILNATVSDAPEVHGSNTTQEPYSSMWRVSGKVIGAKEEKIDDKERTYEIGGVEGSGKIDYLHKSGTLIFGAGLGYDDGLYYHLTLGWNFRDFEFGFFTGHILMNNSKKGGERCIFRYFSKRQNRCAQHIWPVCCTASLCTDILQIYAILAL